MPVLYTAYDCGYSDYIWGAGRMEAEKDYRYANSFLPAF